MFIKLQAKMQGCPHSGYIAWIENAKNFDMVVQGETPEIATRELITSIKVGISFFFGAEMESIVDKEISDNEIYVGLINDLVSKGQSELNFKYAAA